MKIYPNKVETLCPLPVGYGTQEERLGTTICARHEYLPPTWKLKDLLEENNDSVDEAAKAYFHHLDTERAKDPSYLKDHAEDGSRNTYAFRYLMDEEIDYAQTEGLFAKNLDGNSTPIKHWQSYHEQLPRCLVDILELDTLLHECSRWCASHFVEGSCNMHCEEICT